MPIKIVSKQKKALEAFAGPNAITKDQIDELMDKYEKHTGKKRKGSTNVEPYNRLKDTRSAWYSLAEIFTFLKDNFVDLSPGADLSKYGIRIYFGMHHIKNSYQPQPRSGNPEDYHFKDTPLLVLTKKNSNNVDEDQLDEDSTISMAPFSDPGKGLDNARLCPPECQGSM